MERRIERSLLDAKHVTGRFLNADGNAVAVERSAPREDLEHEQRERALKGLMPSHTQHSYSDVDALSTVGETRIGADPRRVTIRGDPRPLKRSAWIRVM
jgi:hypothetical protein